ncbi:MAG: amidohydrolase family protein [Victivallaceae bacterium]|nr:amidohydrolase family protein [Victivallaceae bacterium]
MNELSKWRENYFAIRNQLPWLDAWRPPDAAAVFPGAAGSKIPAVPIVPLLPEKDITAGALAYYRPEAMTLNAAAALAERRCPLIVKATDAEFDQLDRLAAEYPELDLIIASGDRKILYYFTELTALLKKHPRLFLATANLCNMLAPERLEREKLSGKLLYGSFMPFFAEDVAMAPLIMSDLDWRTKCAVAGNNLRKLSGIKPLMPPEIKYRQIKPFVIDAHAHTIHTQDLLRMEVPDWDFQWPQWRDFLDSAGIQKIYITPNEATVLREPAKASALDLCRASQGRMRFFEVFNPNTVEQSLKYLEAALPLPECVGIKIHPAVHQVYASDRRYAYAFAAAEKFGKPLMTHSWEISSYNPAQKFSCPGLFEEHIKAFPKVKFILGHAGGRIGSFSEVVDLCGKYPNVHVDISGDYFHNGMIGNLVAAIGAERVLFASDADWIDPRCIEGMVLGASLSEAELLTIFKTNAERIYK